MTPYYDATLAERTHEAERDWCAECKELLTRLPAYVDVRTKIEVALELLQQRAQKLAQLQDHAAALLADIQPPPIELPRAENDTPSLEPLFDSRADFIATSRRLVQHKQLVDQHLL